MMMHPHTRRALLIMVPLALVAAACGSGEGSSAPETETVTEVVTERDTVLVTPAASDPADADGSDADTTGGDDGQPFPADMRTDTAEPSGRQLTLTDVRVGTHDGYDRVTFEFAGAGTPGWTVGYTDEPVSQGEGREIRIEGRAVLQARIRPAAAPTSDEAYDGRERLDQPQLEVIDEVLVGTTFEGTLGAYIGLTERVPFRVRRFSDPPRVVIDVVHADAAD